jgi:adenylosuccinate lyase
VQNLIIYEENAITNMNKLKGLIYSQRVMLTLIEKAKITREEAYKLVQDCAMQIWENKTTKTFEELLLESSSINGKLNSAEISAIFDISYHTKHIDHIFKMVFSV